MIVHVGHNSLAEACTLASHARSLGADAVAAFALPISDSTPRPSSLPITACRTWRTSMASAELAGAATSLRSVRTGAAASPPNSRMSVSLRYR